MEINEADVAELVDARDLKSLAATDIAQHSCKTSASAPVETAAIPAHLQNKIDGLLQVESARIERDLNQLEIDRRLLGALHDAGRSVLGMPGTVDTFKAMLHRAGLALVLA